MSALRSLIASLFVLLTAVMPAAAESLQLQNSGGVYTLPVRINNAVTIPFIIDSGASEVAIPADVFLVLSRTGTVSQADFLGNSTYTMANGTTQSSKRFLLRKLMVGNHVVTDVVANGIPVNGEPLLGQSFLSRLPSWSIDNARHALVLNDTGMPAPTNSNPYDGRWVADLPVQGLCAASHLVIEVQDGSITGTVSNPSGSFWVRGQTRGEFGRIQINGSDADSGTIAFSGNQFVADYMNASCGPRRAVGQRTPLRGSLALGR